LLRDYQQHAVDAAIEWMKLSLESCVIEAATGAGKSHIIAAIAHKASGRTLCLAPSKELVEQNHEKYLKIGEPASIYCASAGRKELAHEVVFGSPKSVLNNIDKFGKYTLVIIDECHGITPTIKHIIAELKNRNKRLRVLGLSATPYRLDSGYIYQYNINDKPVPGINAYFFKLVYRITTRELIEQRYLTPAHAEGLDGYKTQHLTVDSMGRFDPKEVEQVFVGKGRKTAKIVEDIVAHCIDRLGVIIFAASIDHAYEVYESLPKNSGIVHGKTSKKERERIINDFKAQKIKYLVNVAVLTTGFDAPHVDCVVLLRATESPSLMQQMIGRGLRLYEAKSDCLVLDYAENIERHCETGDLFDPNIKQPNERGESKAIQVTCPSCSVANEFTFRPSDDYEKYNEFGYYLDLMDEVTEMPAHFGRRCCGYVIENSEAVRCDYRWMGKECPDCGHHNDIAARKCEECGEELIDPNEKLKLEFKRIKSDPRALSTDKVLSWKVRKHTSNAGNPTARIDWTTEYRTFSVWYMPQKRGEWNAINMAVYGRVAPDVDKFVDYIHHGKMPETITCKKDNNNWYQVYGYNNPEDQSP